MGDLQSMNRENLISREGKPSAIPSRVLIYLGRPSKCHETKIIFWCECASYVCGGHHDFVCGDDDVSEIDTGDGSVSLCLWGRGRGGVRRAENQSRHTYCLPHFWAVQTLTPKYVQRRSPPMKNDRHGQHQENKNHATRQNRCKNCVRRPTPELLPVRAPTPLPLSIQLGGRCPVFRLVFQSGRRDVS